MDVSAYVMPSVGTMAAHSASVRPRPGCRAEAGAVGGCQRIVAVHDHVADDGQVLDVTGGDGGEAGGGMAVPTAARQVWAAP